MSNLKKTKETNTKMKKGNNKDHLPRRNRKKYSISTILLIVIVISFIALTVFQPGILDENYVNKQNKTDYEKENMQSTIYEIDDSSYVEQNESIKVEPLSIVESIGIEEEIKTKQTGEYEELKAELAQKAEEIRQINENILLYETKLANMEKEVQNLKMNSYLAPLAISIIELKNIVKKGGNFEGEIENIEYLANGNSIILTALDEIKPYSEGIKSDKYIENRFFEIVNEVIRESRRPSEEEGWIEKIKYNFTQSIIIRKVDKSKNPSDLETIIIDTEKYMNEGDYENAIYKIGELDKEHRKFFDDWIKDTAEYLYVNNILDGLMKYMREL
ncbi:mitofilin family membrane protein [Pseudomonadota bacterium]